jgi:hypothetical protein
MRRLAADVVAMWYRDERDFDHLFDGLRKAGLPE